MKKAIIVILCIIILSGIMFLAISSYKTNSMKIKYEEAVEAAKNKDLITARQLFSELPMDYQYEKKEWKTITVEDWIESIDSCANSPFIGEWEGQNSQGTWSVDIYLSVQDFRGVYIAYFRSYTSPGGVRLSDFGDLYTYNDGITASYSSSEENSNAGHYKLKLKNSNALELLFDNELEVILNRQ